MKTPITILALLVALAALSAPALAQSAETGLPHRIDYKLDLRFFARGAEISSCTIYLYPGSVSTMITGEHIGTGQAGGRPDTKYSTYVTVAALDPEAAPASIARTHSAELAVYNASARFQIGEIYLSIYDAKADRFEVTIGKAINFVGLPTIRKGAEFPMEGAPMGFSPWGYLCSSLVP